VWIKYVIVCVSLVVVVTLAQIGFIPTAPTPRLASSPSASAGSALRPRERVIAMVSRGNDR
jgi:hypothetical protein